jgi:transposase
MDEQQLLLLALILVCKPTGHGFGTQLWTLKRVGVLIERQFGVKFGQAQIWRILGGLGLSVQKLERRTIERDEDSVQTCKRRTWPGLKKKPSERGS